MAPKRAKFFYYGDDARTEEVRKFIEDAGIMLDMRDMSQRPLTRYELSDLIGHLNIEHFINKASEAYAAHGLDGGPLDREKVLDLMAQDYTLIRKPIIVYSRLLTIGYDRKKITEMFQINSNGQAEPTIPENRGNRRMAAGANC